MNKGFGLVSTIVAIFVAIGALGVAPAVVDTIDQMPDSPFYGIEKLGETEKITFKLLKHKDLAVERVKEFRYMVAIGEGENYLFLLDDALAELDLATKNFELGVGDVYDEINSILNEISNSEQANEKEEIIIKIERAKIEIEVVVSKDIVRIVEKALEETDNICTTKWGYDAKTYCESYGGTWYCGVEEGAGSFGCLIEHALLEGFVCSLKEIGMAENICETYNGEWICKQGKVSCDNFVLSEVLS